jgi:hypothetical protein
VSAELVVRPGQEIPSWGDFISTHPPFSIALDGYVIAPPNFINTPDGPYANLDHHFGVNRLATLSTAQQALRDVRSGLAEAYTKDSEYRPTVYANGCDQDVALAWYLLSHAPDISKQKYKKHTVPLANLVEMAGNLDATAGAYPYRPNIKLMRQVAWMFRPYTERCNEGNLRSLNPAVYRQIIGECCGRIGLHLAGRGNEIPLDARYEVIGGGTNWSMITEVGPEGRIGAFSDGVKAYIIHKGMRENGKHDYAVGRSAKFVPFNVKGLVGYLNEIEGCPPQAGWGGSDTVGGSPRLEGSRLDPATLNALVNDYPRLQQ